MTTLVAVACLSMGACDESNDNLQQGEELIAAMEDAGMLTLSDDAGSESEVPIDEIAAEPEVSEGPGSGPVCYITCSAAGYASFCVFGGSCTPYGGCAFGPWSVNVSCDVY